MPEEKPDMREIVQQRRVRAIARATAGNVFLGGLSLVGTVFGGGNASSVEAVHDFSDAATHGLDMQGARLEEGRSKRALRYASGIGIVGTALYFGWRSGVDIFNADAQTPGVTATGIQAGVAAGNYALHNDMEHERHEIDLLIQNAASNGEDTVHYAVDENIDGSHRHLKMDAIVSPALFIGMASSEALGRPEIANVTACLGSLAIAAGNAEILLPKNLRFTRRC